MSEENRWTVAFLEVSEEQIRAMEKASGVRAWRVEMGDGNNHADHESGPLIAEELTRLQGVQDQPLRWEELSHREKRAAVAAAAESPGWRQGDLDPHRADQLLEDHPQLKAKLNPGKQQDA